MIFEEKTISSEIVYEGPVFRIRKHLVETVNGGESIRDIVEHSGGSILVAITDKPCSNSRPGRQIRVKYLKLLR